MKPLLFDDIDSPSPFGFEVRDQPAGEERSSTRARFDQEVQIAVVPSGASREGSENPHSSHDMFCRDGENRVALGEPEFFERHRDTLFSLHGDGTIAADPHLSVGAIFTSLAVAIIS